MSSRARRDVLYLCLQSEYKVVRNNDEPTATWLTNDHWTVGQWAAIDVIKRTDEIKLH